ncbi:MAG: hypothetical protein ACJAXL_001648 [Alphaproteobacteria bacterium]|jgi:hypothetical protein
MNQPVKRLTHPFYVPEINMAAKTILKKLHEKDSEQVKGFVESIGKNYEDFKQKLL